MSQPTRTAPRAVPSGLPVPLDAPSAARLYGAGERFRWATPLDAYRPLSYELVDAVVDTIWDAADNTHLRTAALSVAFDIYMEFQRVDRLAIDLENIRRADGRAVYDPADNRLLAYLESGEADADLSCFAADLARHRAPGTRGASSEQLKNIARGWRRNMWMRLLARSRRVDLLARSPLIDNYLAHHPAPTVDLQHYLFDWPDPVTPDCQTDALARALVGARDGLLAQSVESPDLRDRATAWAETYARERLARARADWNFVLGLPIERRGADTLLTGAPKDLGRLLSARYQLAGREVVRFTHGGERGFYDDYHWGLRELPFCDRYYAHGRGEAANLEHRLAEGRTLSGTRQQPVFDSLGSPRQDAIYRAHAGAEDDTRAGTVMFVACSLLGEHHSDALGAKPPDTLSLDLELRLCGAMRDADHAVTFKAHPKSMVDAGSLPDGLAARVAGGSYDPIGDTHECLVFDYAGSAFFDALATNRRVVLVDTGIRPFDPNAEADIATRCRIVRTTVDADNRLAFDADELVRAIAEAPRGCPPAFHEKYFQA